MGAQLISRVYTSWTHLPDRPFRALCYMALICLDTDAQPKFYAGRASLVEALGLTDDDSGQRMTRRVVAALVDAGCIERARTGHRGKRSEYWLTLDKGDSRVLPKGDSRVRNRGTLESAIGGPWSPQ